MQSNEPTAAAGLGLKIWYKYSQNTAFSLGVSSSTYFSPPIFTEFRYGIIENQNFNLVGRGVFLLESSLANISLEAGLRYFW